MPTYDYKCRNCSHQFEEFQKMNDEPLKTCPVCKGEVQRLITGGTGLIFKGSGFYITDYKNDKKGETTAGSEKTKDGDANSKDSSSKSNDNNSKNPAKSVSKDKNENR